MSETEQKRKVILVTDGDRIARRAVERATVNIGGRCISASAGNPTPINGEKIVELIKRAAHDPVVVMFDDKGSCQRGKGERALEYVAGHPDLEVMGVLAIASNTESIEGVCVDCAITKDKQVVKGQVDKEGNLISDNNILMGDTVDVLNNFDKNKAPFVIGMGDIGKMDGKDDADDGAEVTTKALKTIIEHWQSRQVY